MVRPGGLVLRADVAPGWYGGDMNPVITGKPRDETLLPGMRDYVLAELGHEAWDVYQDQDYGADKEHPSVECIMCTYGFIHNQRVIDYIREHRVTTIR